MSFAFDAYFCETFKQVAYLFIYTLAQFPYFLDEENNSTYFIGLLGLSKISEKVVNLLNVTYD